MQVTLSLAIVLALIYLSAKYLLPRLKLTPKGSNIQVLDRMGLEPQVTLYHIKSDKGEYLVGVSSKNIALIDKYGVEK
jgi:flagellar biogenesis protein FliO